MKLSSSDKFLAVLLAAYIVCDVLLTPPAGLETRPVSHVTGLGFVVLGLLFVGLALAIVSLVLRPLLPGRPGGADRALFERSAPRRDRGG